MVVASIPIAFPPNRPALDADQRDQVRYALEYLQDIQHELAMSLVDPTNWPAHREEIAESVSTALELLTGLFQIPTPTTPRWLGQPEDAGPLTTLRDLAAERRVYRRVVREFVLGRSGTEIAWAIDEEERTTAAAAGWPR